MSIRKAKGAKIKYGKVALPAESFSPSATRLRISIMVPGDVLAKIRGLAAEEGTKYQTLINRILRDATMGERSIKARLERLEREFERAKL